MSSEYWMNMSAEEYIQAHIKARMHLTDPKDAGPACTGYFERTIADPDTSSILESTIDGLGACLGIEDTN